MKIKKVVAKTEREAVEKIKETCGEDALILNVQTKQSNGVWGIFKKQMVVVTAAYEEKEPLEVIVPFSDKAASETPDFVVPPFLGKEPTAKPTETAPSATPQAQVAPQAQPPEQKQEPTHAMTNKDAQIQKGRIEYLEKTLSAMSRKLTASQFTENTSRVFDNHVLQVFYEALVAQGVLDYAAKDILTQVAEATANEASADTLDIGHVSAQVYAKIIGIINKPRPIVGGEKALFVFFVGPTGVGKTTTIAKLASRLVLEQNIRVGLITADTYRIAAVEQLKVYAEILNLEIDVIYEKQDFITSTQKMEVSKDVVFVDTAGRSHKNKKNLLDLKELVSADIESEKYLVLSMTTKYEDLLNIINTYNDIGEFKLILTKFDETMHYGSVFNLCYNLGLEIVYITTGQSVPEDIELLQPEKIAKALLGLETGL